MTKNLFTFLFGLVLAGAVNFTIKAEPIVFVLNDWASQRVHTIAIAQTLEEYGVEVEFVQMGYAEQFGALRAGIAHVQIEAWEPDKSDTYERMISYDQITVVGDHEIKAREEWWYPKYVEKLCPGLPDWRALNDCAEIFVNDVSAKENMSKGTYFRGGWDNHDAEINRALDLNFEIKSVSGSAELWNTLNRFSEQNVPIVLHNWTPNWTDKYIPGEFVKFPAYAPECEDDPSWGINKNMTHDCANREGKWIQKLIWPGLKDKSPCVYQFIKQVRFSREMLEDAPSLVFVDDLNEQKAAEHWRKKYNEQLEKWVSTSCLTN